MSETRDITRRDAVKIAGVAATAAAVVQGAPAIMKVRAANEQLQYGMIGTGSRGDYLLGQLRSVDNGRCVALCDVYEPNLKQAVKTIGSSPKEYKDYREMLANKDIDAVLIAVPLYLHFPVTKDALLAGKHVFCEKSLVFKPEEVHALRTLANERPKQVLQTGLQRRYSKFYQVAKQMVDKGMLGDVTHIRAQWHRNGSGRRPVKDPSLERQFNWRFYKDLSGGLTAELASHQIDIADWMFGSLPEYVMGVGGIDYYKDGRTTYDNVQMIYKYPQGQKLIYSSISTNSHMELLDHDLQAFGEVIMGTQGSIEITINDGKKSPRAMWFREPSPPKVLKAGAAKANWTAGATVASAASSQKGIPLPLEEDEKNDKDSFIDREKKFGRRWLYSKGVLIPEENRNPVQVQFDDFFNCCKTGARPKADLEVGLADSTGVILSNLAMDEGRRVAYSEIDKMGRGTAPGKSAKSA